MRRGDLFVANLPAPVGRRPVLIVTRTPALAIRTAVTVAPVTRTNRSIASEVPLGTRHGLRAASVANCDALQTIPKDALGRRRLGTLAADDLAVLDRALVYALGIAGLT
ncbi:MAG: type II toxin-antitoxin system PemK/MazF family toxin [Planctomycetaceae bacterium]